MSTTSKQPKSRNRDRRVFSARVKSEAVLSVWAERRKPSEVCKELQINWATLNSWQNQALRAMMSALEPRTRNEEERGPALGQRLEKLLSRTEQRASRMNKLQKRLEKIQEQKTAQK